MGIAIRGEFTATGLMLAVATQRAQAVTRGDLAKKRAAGVGVLEKHLGEAWAKASSLTLGVVTARACLSAADLREAGRLFEQITDAEQRKAILEKLLTPHFVSTLTLFGQPFGEATAAEQDVDAAKLTEALQPRLPSQELLMVANDTAGKGKLISQKQVTNEQWAIAMEQAGLRAPYYWADAGLGKDNRTAAVVGVDYTTDAVGFTKWLDRSVPTKTEFLAAKRAGILQADKPWEWTNETTRNGNQVYRSVRIGSGSYSTYSPGDRSHGNRAFRVAEGG